MVVKVYISGISGNKEVKKRQQRVLMILDSKNIKYDVIDITEPGKESEKEFMQSNSKSNGGTVSDPNPRSPLPPQLFCDEEYCGDYDQFDMANEMDVLEQFLKQEVPPQDISQEDNKENTLNGDVATENNLSKENSQDRDGTPNKEGTPLRDATPAKDSVTSKEGSPADGEKLSAKGESPAKEGSPDKESSPERQKSVEKEGTPSEKAASAEKEEVESTKTSKESSPEKVESVNENGTVSSREQSEEKDAAGDTGVATERKKDDPSEALIQSEQEAATE